MEGLQPTCDDVALPEELQARVLELLPPNDRALSGRFASKSASRHLSQHCKARLSLPLPRHAVVGDLPALLQPALKKLSFKDKLDLPSVAAASGSEANLELAWNMLRPCLFPELLSEPGKPSFYRKYASGIDAGTAAVRAGHAHLLPWLLRHKILLDPDATLEAVAELCDLAGLQQTWDQLGGDSILARDRDMKLASAAGRSGVAPIAKLSWLLAKAGGEVATSEQMMWSAAEGAASSGNKPVIQWLLGQGLDWVSWPGPNRRLSPRPDLVFPSCKVVAAALQHGHVAMADWLVDEAGCRLPYDEEEEQGLHLWTGASRGGSVAAVHWLRSRGVLAHQPAAGLAALVCRLGTAQVLHEEWGLPLTRSAFGLAAGLGCMPTVRWLRQAGCPMGFNAYDSAALKGDNEMVRWLAKEAKCPWAEDTVTKVISRWPTGQGDGGGLEQAVRVLVEAGCQPSLECAALDRVAFTSCHLPVLRYLHEERGAQMGLRTLAAAAKGGCEAVLEWLVGPGGVAGEFDAQVLYATAASQGDLATLSCLRRLGVPWGARPLELALGNNAPLPVIRWLVEQGAPWDREVVERVVRGVGMGSRFGDAAAWLRQRLWAAGRAGRAAE